MVFYSESCLLSYFLTFRKQYAFMSLSVRYSFSFSSRELRLHYVVPPGSFIQTLFLSNLYPKFVMCFMQCCRLQHIRPCWNMASTLFFYEQWYMTKYTRTSNTSLYTYYLTKIGIILCIIPYLLTLHEHLDL